MKHLWKNAIINRVPFTICLKARFFFGIDSRIRLGCCGRVSRMIIYHVLLVFIPTFDTIGFFFDAILLLHVLCLETASNILDARFLYPGANHKVTHSRFFEYYTIAFDTRVNAFVIGCLFPVFPPYDIHSWCHILYLLRAAHTPRFTPWCRFLEFGHHTLFYCSNKIVQNVLFAISFRLENFRRAPHWTGLIRGGIDEHVPFPTAWPVETSIRRLNWAQSRRKIVIVPNSYFVFGVPEKRFGYGDMTTVTFHTRPQWHLFWP